jgi:signal transduction histidine kinase
VIVNAHLETVAHSGKTPAFLGPLADTQEQRVIESVEKSQADKLKDAIRAARKAGHSVRVEQVKVGEGEGLREVNAEVSPLGPEMQHFVIVFEEGGEKPAADSAGGGPPTRKTGAKFDGRISRLEKELASTRAHLESIIIEQEAAHEEVVASNEELQSLNEELESSQEELQASNEELTTVNQELQVRNGELDNAREFAQATVDTVRGSLVVLGPDLRVLKANHSFYRTFRLSPAEVEHCLIYELGGGHWSLPQLRVLLEEVLPKNQRMEDFEMEYESPATGRRILVLNAHRFERQERILLAMEDVTQIRRVEEELRQSQKMEAIGYLAAGVAHDFNNLLTGIMGNASLLLDKTAGDDPARSKLGAVVNAAERAADLTRQLMAYAGKGRFYMERVDLSDLAVQTSKLIHPSIPANVQLRLDLDRHLPLLLADPGQLHQLVMNLAINGAEAIGDTGGVVLVRTGRQTVTEEPLPDLYFNEKKTPGEYVYLEVQDNGSGMDEQTKRKIFDPFFTTKFTGRGLGLASVLGILQHHKGLIEVHSVPGRGSSFRVLFPVTGNVPPRNEEALNRAELRGSGTVLVVDDEEMIRDFTRWALEPYGYEVLLARDGPEGIGLIQRRSSDIGLVLLDVAMPGMNGLETLDRIREIRPDVPVLVCSGFGDSDVEERFARKQVAGFLPKPYTVTQIAKKVKECIRPCSNGD